MKNKILLLIIFIISLQQLYSNDSCNSYYTIKKGDNLSKISQYYYNTRTLWDIIYQRNNMVIGNKPSNIQVGMKIYIPCLKKEKFDNVSKAQNIQTNTKYTIEFLAGDGFAPFKDRSLPNDGMGTEILHKVMAQIPNVKYSIDWINDFSSHLMLLKKQKYDMSYTWFKPDCSNLKELSKKTQLRCEFLFSKPMYSDLVVFFKRADDNTTLNNFSELKNKTICRPKGYFTFDLEKESIKNNINLKLLQPNSVDDCFRMLMDKKVDFVTINKLTGMQSIKRLKLDKKVYSLEELSTIQDMCFIIHRSHPNAQIYINLINKALNKLKKSGELSKIQTKHLIYFYNNLK